MVEISVSLWFLIFMVFYSYLGYGIALFVLVKLKRVFQQKHEDFIEKLPEITLLIAAYNEESFIRRKIENTLKLNYPSEKIRYLFVTDGSTDKTPEILSEFPQVEVLHQPERKGKIAAVNRAMKTVTSPIVIFTDANTLLNENALTELVKHFSNEKTGAVAGEKRILQKKEEEAAGAGEGIYWKYESLLKKWDAELYSVVGAAGELYAIRTELYEQIATDTLIEDFYLTLRIAQKGFKVAYEPDAFAMEEPSSSVSEELKRKIRIAAGGIQSIVRLKGLLNPFKYGILSFQYISHRVLRWTLAPAALPLIFILNVFLALSGNVFYSYLLLLQVIFYLAAFIGYLLERKNIRLKLLFVPYYFCMMNYAVYRGFIRYIKGSQSVIWEKAERRSATHL